MRSVILEFPHKLRVRQPGVPEKCCDGGTYSGHSVRCKQPEYAGPPPLPGHGFCPCGNAGGNYCWRNHR